MRRLAVLVAALPGLWACGNSALAIKSDPGQDTPPSLDVPYDHAAGTDEGFDFLGLCGPGYAPGPWTAKFDSDCAGGHGCTYRDDLIHCECGCSVCADETCLEVLCDDSCGDPDVIVNDPGPGTDKGDPGSKPDGTTDAEKDAGTDPGPDIPSCPVPEGSKKMGTECTEDCECEHGLCYREEYLKPYGICTKECLSTPDGCVDLEKFACVAFPTIVKEAFEMKIGSLCMPICASVADCKKYADFLTYCSSANATKMTEWKPFPEELPYTISGKTTCQVKKM